MRIMLRRHAHAAMRRARHYYSAAPLFLAGTVLITTAARHKSATFITLTCARSCTICASFASRCATCACTSDDEHMLETARRQNFELRAESAPCQGKSRAIFRPPYEARHTLAARRAAGRAQYAAYRAPACSRHAVSAFSAPLVS